MVKPGIDLLHLVFFISSQFISNWPSHGKVVSKIQAQAPFTKQPYKLQIKEKKEIFLCNKRKIVVKPTIHQNSTVSKTFLRKF